jgi:hypothetical protein
VTGFFDCWKGDQKIAFENALGETLSGHFPKERLSADPRDPQFVAQLFYLFEVNETSCLRAIKFIARMLHVPNSQN